MLKDVLIETLFLVPCHLSSDISASHNAFTTNSRPYCLIKVITGSRKAFYQCCDGKMSPYGDVS